MRTPPILPPLPSDPPCASVEVASPEAPDAAVVPEAPGAQPASSASAGSVPPTMPVAAAQVSTLVGRRRVRSVSVRRVPSATPSGMSEVPARLSALIDVEQQSPALLSPAVLVALARAPHGVAPDAQQGQGDQEGEGDHGGPGGLNRDDHSSVDPGAAGASARPQLRWPPRAGGDRRTSRRGQSVERELIRRPLGRPMTIVVANPKGGAGKTPATVLLSAVLGTARGGSVLAWDNNETRGTLGSRAMGGEVGSGVRDLIADLPRYERGRAGIGDLATQVRTHEQMFDVLARGEDVAAMRAMTEREFVRCHDVLSRFYRILVIDTGNNVHAPIWRAALSRADVLVVVSSHDQDTVDSAQWMLDHLIADGHAELVSHAVTVITHAAKHVAQRERRRTAEAFTRTAAVLEAPWEPVLRGGGQIDLTALRGSSRQAWTAVGAAVCTQLAAAAEPAAGTTAATPGRKAQGEVAVLPLSASPPLARVVAQSELRNTAGGC
ncbi:MAG: hypothetical protein ACT4PP_13300 [Sporichthyaceae bacterium]